MEYARVVAPEVAEGVRVQVEDVPIAVDGANRHEEWAALMVESTKTM
jgi:hypothetical protein